MFDDLAVAVKEFNNTDWHAMTDDERNAAVLLVTKLQSAFAAGQSRMLADWDAEKSWAPSGAQTATAWLTARTHLPAKDIGGRLRLGRTMRRMPLAAEAWLAGDIDGVHLRHLTHLINPRTEEAFARDEDRLVNWARTLDFKAFARKADVWLLQHDLDGADQNDMDRFDRRRVSLNETFGGMFYGSITLDPISGTIVHNELHRIEQDMFDTDWKTAKDTLGRDPLPSELARTPDQRRADALVEMAIRSAATPADARKPKPLFTVVLGNPALSWLSQLEGGPVIGPRAMLPWLTDAELERILFADGTSRVIDVSRKRTFTGALRRLIQVRDQQCFHPDCDVPATRCQTDHITPYNQGGWTSQDNGRAACGFHNRARNRREPPDDDPDEDDD